MPLTQDVGDQCPWCGSYAAIINRSVKELFVTHCHMCGRSGFYEPEEAAATKPNGIGASDTLEDILASAEDEPKPNGSEPSHVEAPKAEAPKVEALLEPDAKQLGDFIQALFRHATKGTFVSLRGFEENRDGDKPFCCTPMQVDDTRARLISTAIVVAQNCAQAKIKVVFCPPVATFNDRRKADEEHLAEGLALAVECDGRSQEALDKLSAILGPPTVVVLSGGEWTNPATGEIEPKRHLYWRLAVPTRAKRAHASLKRAREIAAKIVGADTSNVPIVHPIRWPGSWHRKAEPRLCRIESIDPNREIDLDTALTKLEAACPQAKPSAGKANSKSSGKGWAAQFKEIVDRADGLKPQGWHRAVAAIAMMMLKAGTFPGAVVNQLRDLFETLVPEGKRNDDWQARYNDIPRAVSTAQKKLGINDAEPFVRHGADAGPQAAEEAAAGAAQAGAIDPVTAAIEEANRAYALVLVGDKAAILEETGLDYRLLGINAFKQWMSNRTIANTKIQLAGAWLASPQRRQYNNIVFSPGLAPPGAYNLWRGFAVKPVKGDCSKFLAHLKNNVCRGGDNLYAWVIAWMADIFQNPATKCGTALALRGPMGCGKTIVGTYLRSLLGVHYWLVEHPDHVTGKFNAHLARLLLIHCDEAFWAGEKQGLGRLRSMITGDKQSIEFKGKDLIQVDSFLRMLVTGDERWVVPAGLKERRFAVLDVGSGHLQDHKYFAAVDHEMKHGGAEALLYHLLNEVDIGKVNLRGIPQTTALTEQKIATMDPQYGWWLDLLRQGELPGDRQGTGMTPRQLIFDAYVEHAKKIGAGRRAIETQLGIFIKTVAPGVRADRATVTIETFDRRSGLIRDRQYRGVYRFPELSACREEFAKQCNVDSNLEWEGCPETWQPDQVAHSV